MSLLPQLAAERGLKGEQLVFPSSPDRSSQTAMDGQQLSHGGANMWLAWERTPARFQREGGDVIQYEQNEIRYQNQDA